MSIALEYGIPTDAAGLQLRLGAIKQPMRAQDIVDLRFLPAPLVPQVRAAAG